MERIEVSVQVHREHGGFHGEQREHKVDLLFFSQCSLCQLSVLCVRPELFDNENSLQTEQIPNSVFLLSVFSLLKWHKD